MSRRKKGNKIDGWINLDKPVGMGSTQALAKVRWLLNAQKAGHAGTLDPLASGILPIALGEATKTIPFAQDHLKTYEFTITWGENRSTEDAEGEITARSDTRPTQTKIESALPAFIGEIQQIPPRFSAIKVEGERAYDLAREGEDFDLNARNVYVESLCITQPPHLSSPHGGEGYEELAQRAYPKLGEGDFETSTAFQMTCGKGTYVRAICRDLAQKLGACGYISSLRRTAVGHFTQDNAISLDKLAEMMDSPAALPGGKADFLLPLETVLDDIPALAMKADETAKLRSGQILSFVSKPDYDRLITTGLEGKNTALAVFQSRPVALVEIEGHKIKPVRVFNL